MPAGWHSGRPVKHLRHLHHLHATAPSATSAGSSLPQIACSSEGAPIHALFPVARVPFTVPKAFAVPFLAAIASAVPGSTFTPGVGAGGVNPIALAPAPHAGNAVTQPSANNLTLSSVLTDPTPLSSPLPVVGDDVIAPTLFNRISPGADALFPDGIYPSDLNILTPTTHAVPEPPTCSLLAFGAILLAVLRRRRRSAPKKAK